MRIISVLWTLMLLTASAIAGPGGDGAPVRIYTSEEPFQDVVENVRTAIIDRGMLVSGTLHLGDMLNRTGPDLGFPPVFTQAESVEFCSALISHKMARAAAQNMANCPFTIAIYVKADEPGKVYLAYRLPRLVGDVEEVNNAIVEMLDGIVQDSQ